MALVSAGVVWLGLGALDPAPARTAHDDFETAAERWAWSQIKQGGIADFNKHCGTPQLDPNDEKDTRWQDDCRNLPSRFLQDLLARAPWREQVPDKGVRGLRGISILKTTLSKSSIARSKARSA